MFPRANSDRTQKSALFFEGLYVASGSNILENLFTVYCVSHQFHSFVKMKMCRFTDHCYSECGIYPKIS